MVKGFGERWFKLILLTLLLSACAVGPNYVVPSAPVPVKYKEGAVPPKGWKVATPLDEQDRGPWWAIFGNPELNALEAQVNVSNQNIAVAVAQYDQSVALVAEARSALFPVVGVFANATRQKPPASSFNSNSGTGTGGQTASMGKSLPPFNTFLLNFDASWQPDIFGGVRRSIEASKDTAQATAAQVAAVRLSSQALLAQDYFQLRTLDVLQKVFNDTVAADEKLLQIANSRFQAGTDSLADVAQAQATLEAAQATAIDNGISRAQFEHAIATLIGLPPASFSLAPKIIAMRPPIIPAQVPSELLERRPDISEAERQMAAANAQIGVAIAAFFPTFPLTASSGFQSNKFPLLFNSPSSFWTLGAEAMETIFEGGFRLAATAAARAAYRQTVANYREVVLSAFQNVEDNLASQRILIKEVVVQKQAVATAKLALRLQTSDYRAGTTDLTTVLVAQTTALTSEQNEVNVVGRQMTAAVGLITALGGGWDVRMLPKGSDF